MPDPINDFNKSEPTTPDQPSASDNAFSTVPSVAEATPTESPDIAPFTPDDTPKKSKKKLIFAGLGAMIALLAVLGGTAYAFYFSNPEKVLLDAFQNSLKAKTAITKGDFTVTDKASGGKIAVTFASQSDNQKLSGSLETKIKIDYDQVNLELDAAGMAAENGDFYFKVKNAPALFDQALTTEYGKLYASDPSVAPLIAKLKAFFVKIDGQWIRVDKDVISQYSEDYDKEQECTDKAVAAFYKDSAQQQQVIDAYTKNRFIKIEDTGKTATINSQDSIAYDIAFNVKEGEAFGDDLVKTDVIKAIEKCDESTETVEKSEDMTAEETKQAQKDADNIKTTIWISRWSHELQKVQVENKDKEDASAAFNITLDTKTPPNLKAPAKSLEAKDLMQELQAIYTEAFGATTSDFDATQI